MCLEVIAIVSSDAAASVSASKLAEVSGMVVKSQTFEGRKALHLSLNGGCSCDLLSDAADWEADSWALLPESLPKLEAAFCHLASHAKRFSVLAHWLGGERPRSSVRVGASQLAKLVHANDVGNNVLYHVGHGG